MGVLGWKVIKDNITLEGVVKGAENGEKKTEAIGKASDGDWYLNVEPLPEYAHLLKNRRGVSNPNGLVECEVEPPSFIDKDSDSNRVLQGYFSKFLEKQVTVFGPWVEDRSHKLKTEIHPLTSILMVDDGEDGSKTVHFMAFCDSSDNNLALVPFSHENRNARFKVKFPVKPSGKDKVFEPNLDVLDENDFTLRKALFIMHGLTPGQQDYLVCDLDTGVEKDVQGFYYGKYVISYREVAESGPPVNVSPKKAKLTVTCIEYGDSRKEFYQSDYISFFSGNGDAPWRLSRDEVISLILSEEKAFEVRDAAGNTFELVVINTEKGQIPSLSARDGIPLEQDTLNIPVCPPS